MLRDNEIEYLVNIICYIFNNYEYEIEYKVSNDLPNREEFYNELLVDLPKDKKRFRKFIKDSITTALDFALYFNDKAMTDKDEKCTIYRKCVRYLKLNNLENKEFKDLTFMEFNKYVIDVFTDILNYIKHRLKLRYLLDKKSFREDTSNVYFIINDIPAKLLF